MTAGIMVTAREEGGPGGLIGRTKAPSSLRCVESRERSWRVLVCLTYGHSLPQGQLWSKLSTLETCFLLSYLNASTCLSLSLHRVISRWAVFADVCGSLVCDLC